MTLLRLIRKNITGSPFRSGSILLAAVLVASLSLFTTFIVRGAEASLRQNISRLGADLMVLPWGTITQDMEGAQMLSIPTQRWMAHTKMQEISAVEGVVLVSPQVYLGSLSGSPLLESGEVLVIGFDPATDFTVLPWLEDETLDRLLVDEVILGSNIAYDPGIGSVDFYGRTMMVAGRLLSNGTAMDNSVFVSMETAQAILSDIQAKRVQNIKAVAGSVSALLVRVDLSTTPAEVAFHIYENVDSVVPVLTSDFIQSERTQMVVLLRSIIGLLAGTWILSVLFVGLVFSIAVHERRREVAMLRALGSPWSKIFWMIMGEGFLLAGAGGLLGIFLSGMLMVLFRNPITSYLGVPFMLPSMLSLALMVVVGLALAMASVFVGALIPAYRLTREEVALMMRE